MGATDYISKLRLMRLGPAVKRTLAEIESRNRARELEAENQKLEAEFLRMQRLESIGALAQGIAHDLNNTLAPVLMGIQLVREEIKNPDRLRMLETMQACAQRSAEMVNQILSFARGVSAKPAVLDPGPLVVEIAKLCGDTFPRSIELATKVAQNLHLVECNATQLHQVLLNLCVNARDAMPEGGQIDVRVVTVLRADQSQWAVLEVEDHGVGIAPEVLRHIFEPFFSTKVNGTGLGLSVARRICVAHGGRLTAENVDNGGARFRVVLPALMMAEAT
jgi:signal transduction histidine kinase